MKVLYMAGTIGRYLISDVLLIMEIILYVVFITIRTP